MAATFVRPRLRFWCSFSRSRFSLPLWQYQGFGGLPVCQRLRRQLVPCGEAFWPQPLPASQAPAGNTFLGLVARFSASGLSSSRLILKKSILRACVLRKISIFAVAPLLAIAIWSSLSFWKPKSPICRLPFLWRRGSCFPQPPRLSFTGCLSSFASSSRSPFGIAISPCCLPRGRSSMRCPRHGSRPRTGCRRSSAAPCGWMQPQTA